MPLSHIKPVSSISTQEIFNQLSNSVSTLYKNNNKEEFYELEKQLHQQFAEAERQCMAKLLKQYDWNYPVFMSGNSTYRRSSRNKKTYMTLAGEVTLERTLYRKLMWMSELIFGEILSERERRRFAEIN